MFQEAESDGLIREQAVLHHELKSWLATSPMHWTGGEVNTLLVLLDEFTLYQCEAE